MHHYHAFHVLLPAGRIFLAVCGGIVVAVILLCLVIRFSSAISKALGYLCEGLFFLIFFPVWIAGQLIICCDACCASRKPSSTPNPWHSPPLQQLPSTTPSPSTNNAPAAQAKDASVAVYPPQVPPPELPPPPTPAPDAEALSAITNDRTFGRTTLHPLPYPARPSN